jgi:hypothetical protein
MPACCSAIAVTGPAIPPPTIAALCVCVVMTEPSHGWLEEILAIPRNEFPEFPAALSFLPMLTPEKTAELLDRRRESLAHRLAERDAAISAARKDYELPRVALLETGYLHAVIEAELRWIDTVRAGLRDGSITWSPEELQAIARQWQPAPVTASRA